MGVHRIGEGSDDVFTKGDRLSTHREPIALHGSVPACPGRSVGLGLAGALVAFIFTAVALSGVLGNLRAASFSYTAIVATLTGVICWTLVLFNNLVPRTAARVAVAFAAFFLSVIGSLLVGTATRQGLQFVVVLAAFLGAVLLGSTARRAVGSHLDVVVGRCFRLTASLLIGSAALGALGILNSVDVRPSAIVAVVCIGWFLAEYRLGRRSSLWWSLAALAGVGVSLSRIALLAGFLLVLAAVLLGPSKQHRVSLAILALLLVVSGYWAVTYWPPLRDRFLQGDVSLSVAGFNVNGEGRAQVWSVLWSEWPDQPLLGHGPGAASARALLVSPAFDHPHNDYLLLLYDFGLVGFVLLAWFSLRSARQLLWVRKRSPASIAPLAALNAGFAVLIVMATDNPLDYPFVMIPLGALVGLGLGSLAYRLRSSRISSR